LAPFARGSVNNKPNYLSVMNDTWQACQVPSSPTLFGPPVLPGGCDYSRVNFPSVGVVLNENSLDECQGFDNRAFFGPVDWNGDSALQGNTCIAPHNTNVGPVNVNNDTLNDANKNGGWDPGEPPLYTTLIRISGLGGSRIQPPHRVRFRHRGRAHTGRAGRASSVSVRSSPPPPGDPRPMETPLARRQHQHCRRRGCPDGVQCVGTFSRRVTRRSALVNEPKRGEGVA